MLLDLDGWYVAAGRFGDGSEIDLMAGRTRGHLEKPSLVDAITSMCVSIVIRDNRGNGRIGSKNYDSKLIR